MMNDEELCKFLSSGECSGDNTSMVDSSSFATTPDKSPEPPVTLKHKGIILRKIFTITTVKIYPDGQIYVQDARSWLDKDSNMFKPKAKKKKPKKLQVKKLNHQEVL